MDTKDENKQGAGVHVGSCLKLNSLSQGANAHVDTELSSAAEKTNMTFSSDSNCSRLSASNEGLSTNTNDLNKDSVATHPDSSLQLQTPGTDTHPSLEMEDTSQSEKKNPTSLPDQDHSDLNITRDSLSIDITDKDRQGVDHHSESCLEPESLNTDTHSCQERTFKTSLETTLVSSPDQDCSGSSVTVDTSNKNLSHSESPFKQKSLNTDVQTSVEMEFKSQSEKKNPTSPLDQDCSSPSATCKSPFVDAVDKNKGSVAANPESSLQLEYLNTDTHPLLEGSKESPTSPPDVDCNCPNITSDSLSVNNTDKNKQTVPSISQSSGLTGHLRTHAVGHPFNCKSCNKGFWNKSLLRNHYRNTGLFSVQYQCSECEMSFTDGLVLISHLEDHGRQEQEKKRNTCPKCGRVCTSQGNLEKHMRMHTGDQKFPCFDCSKLFYTRSDLEAHRTYSAPYFPCHVCGKTFPTSESLEDHQLCHLGEKPHECEQCGKCFFQASQLQQHHRMHKSEFQCQTCGKLSVSLCICLLWGKTNRIEAVKFFLACQEND
uniref:C2H2-type domain-containing protein n=1 Tax=Pundamilia nyererei TaxID=303518 RepID=A0A3B4EVS0_9CICH